MIIVAFLFVSYQQLSGLKAGWKSKFTTLDTKIEKIKKISESENIFQIFSTWELSWKKMDFVSPKYYFDITKNLKPWDKIKVELNLTNPSEYRFLDDKLFD